jgi:hypothetical protein
LKKETFDWERDVAAIGSKRRRQFWALIPYKYIIKSIVFDAILDYFLLNTRGNVA